MEKQDIEKLITSSDYDFLRTNPHLGKNNIMFLVLGGSYAYGTNIATSDVDIRGVALNSKEDLIGFSNFEQMVDEKTDTTVYGFNKYINLISNCNPNVVEMMFCKPEHYIWISPLGKLLLDNRKLFLTQRAIYTFGGYAHAQLNRLENAMCRNGQLSQQDKEIHIQRSTENTIDSFSDRYQSFGDNDYLKLHTDTKDSDGNYVLTVDAKLNNYPMRDLTSMIKEMSDVVRDYDKTIGNRNKKDDLHLNKHMMHLIRLYLSAIEILETGDMHTYQDKNHDLLMSIRNGNYRTENEGIKPEFYDLLHSLEDRAEKAKLTTSLPKKPNMKAIEELVMKINSEVLK